MLKASETKRTGLGADCTYEVTEEGAPIGTINDTRATMEVDGRAFSVARKGVFGPEFQLKSGVAIIATAKQKPMFNHFKLAHGGKEWTFKAIGLLAAQFGLFENDSQCGLVSSGKYLARLRDITVELPAELPREVQVFLLLLAIHVWSQQGS